MGDPVCFLPQKDPGPLFDAAVKVRTDAGHTRLDAINMVAADIPDLWIDFRSSLIPVVEIPVAVADVAAAQEFLRLRREDRLLEEQAAAMADLMRPEWEKEGVACRGN